MKRTLLAPLLSALVLPGLGQVINGELRKAGLLIATVSLLFLALFFKVLFDLNKVFTAHLGDPSGSSAPSLPQVAQTLSGGDKKVLFLLLGLFIGIWIYGIWDAYRGARRSEKKPSDAPIPH